MISNREVKRSFKVVLDSYNDNSYRGSQFNAHYYIDLLRLINDDKAYDKQYNIYCQFLSKAENITNNNITTTNNYTLSLNFNNNPPQLFQYNQTKNYSFNLPVENLTDTGGAIHTLFKLNDNTQQPLFIQNIRNLTKINLQVYQNTAGSPNVETIFSPADMTKSKYICVLTFVEA
jgi:hypothetical protein